jgi:CheY-like chemotaxis protein
VVVGGLDLARRKLRGPKREVELHIDNAMEGATRAAALTRRLLAFARSDPLLPEAVAPAALVENMLDLIDRAIGERISVGTHFDEGPWLVWADSGQLENAILNLCVNARDAMDGQGRIDIAVENVVIRAEDSAELAPGDYVRIGVTDTGAGIAPEHIERVFEPFFTTKPVGKGTGLGLSQIFGFARQSGGDVVIESTPGIGTAVSLYLPRSAAVAAAPHGRAPAPDTARAFAGPGHGLPILVVEDDPRVSRSTVSALEELGHAPVACAGGGEALALLDAGQQFDLVVTDVMMPEMSGPELVRILAQRHSGLGVLFVTGFIGEAGEADDLSGYELLRKPFTVAALGEAVDAALARRVSGSPPEPASAAAE